jgi:hypothetical protein
MMKVKISKQYSFWLFILLGVLVGHLWSNPEDEWVIIQLSNDTNDTPDRIDTIETIETIDTIETIETIDTIDKNDTVVVIDSTIHKRNPPPEKTVLLARKKYNELKQTRHIQDLYVPGSWYLLNHGLLTFTFEKYPFNETKRGARVLTPYAEGGKFKLFICFGPWWAVLKRPHLSGFSMDDPYFGNSFL